MESSRNWFAAFVVGFCLTGVAQTVAPILDSSYGYRLPSSPGCAVWWCEATYKVGRARALPAATNSAVSISAARNEYEPFQIVLRPQTNLSNVVVSITDLVHEDGLATGLILRSNVEMCLVEYVPVTTLTDSSGAVGPHPDPLPPLTGPFGAVGGSNQPVWITVYVPRETPAGNYEAALTIQSCSFLFTTPVRLQVRNFTLPDVTHTRTAYFADVHVDPTWHKLATLDQKRLVWDLYMQNFRKHRISPYSAHLYAPPVWTLVNGEFQVDFSDFDAAMTRYVDEFGLNAFNLFGHKSTPFPYSLGGYSAFSPQWRALFAKLMKRIQAHLRERGWADEAYCYWTDEPQGPGFINLLNGMRALNEGAPGLRRLLTFNAYPAAEYDAQLNGQVDTWVPMLPMGAATRFLDRKAAGDENWWYVCVGPHAPHPNNFIDHPAINHRIRFWMAEKYGITGDLYWAVNYWIGRNPWTNPWSFANGDGVLIYPPTKTPPTGPMLAGPVSSLRWELTREALEDAEYFWLLRHHVTNAPLRLGPEHPAVAEAINAREAALALVPDPTHYEKNPQRLYALRDRIAVAIEGLDAGAPMIVRQPQGRAVPTGDSATLRVEALGWPPPAYQWQFNGENLPGATDTKLTLSNFNPSLAGDYRVVAANAAGMATSAVACVEGYWSPLPSIVAHPDGLVRPASEQAIFAVTAVSSNPLSYVWLHNGVPAEGAAATNASLLLTNLATTQAGDYSVVVSTVAGAVTSRVARLTVLANTGTLLLVSSGDSWRYHNLGGDLGGDWQTPLYDDSLWPAGPAPLGFGDGDERSIIGSDRHPGNAPTTFYFRHPFPLAQATLQSSLTGRLLCDDGAVVFLNGDEIFRHNLPAGALDYHTTASQAVDGAAESQFVTFAVPSNLLQPGNNVLAVEVHQSAADLPQPTQPAAYWSFNHPAFPWHDHVGTNDFAPNGGNVVTGPGRFGGGVSNSISATGCLVATDSPEFSYSGPFTVGGWFAFGAGTANRAVGLEKDYEFSLYYTGASLNRYRFELNGTYVQDPTGGTIAGQWRFVVGWHDGTNINIQVDNGVVSSAPASPPRPTSSPLVALRLAQSSGGFAADELFLYKRVLSAAERTAHFQNQLGLNPSDLSFDFALTATGGQLPQLLSAPLDLARRVGDNAAFMVSAVSATPLSYQWHFGGSPLAGATRSLLFLGGVTPAQAGAYSVTVGNLAGKVAAPPATLTVVGIPELRALLAADGSGCSLEIPGSGVPGVILVSSNLLDWSELLRFSASQTPTNIVDSGATNAPSRFYRLRLDL